MPGLDIHAGIWKALHDSGIVATHCAGTSAGAIVSGADAAGRNADTFAAFLASLSDSDVRHERLFWKARFAWIDSFMENDRILKLIRDWIPRDRTKLAKPLRVTAAQAKDGAQIDFDSSWTYLEDFTLCVLASMSICGVFPKVTIYGEEYIDGGVRANLPLPCNWRDYDDVFLLIASGRPEVYHKESGLLTNLIKNIGWLMQDQILDVIDQAAVSSSVHILWPPFNTPKGALRFDHDLIAKSYNWTFSQLAHLKTQS